MASSSTTTGWALADINYGPMTTAFTPAPSCLSLVQARTVERGALVYDALPVLDGQCFPSKYKGDCYPVELDSASIGYFSPGTICPSGWEQAATSTLSSGDTEAYCCPSKFIVAEDGVCQLATSQTLPIAGLVICSAIIPGSMHINVAANTVTTVSSFAGPVTHPAVRIRWNDSEGPTPDPGSEVTVSRAADTQPSSTSLSKSPNLTPRGTNGVEPASRIAMIVLAPIVLLGFLLAL